MVSIDSRNETSTATHSQPPRHGPVQTTQVVPLPGRTDKEIQRGEGLKSLLSGAVLIGIGFAFGGSVFTGDPTMLDWIFDGLGTFWIARGIYQLFA